MLQDISISVWLIAEIVELNTWQQYNKNSGGKHTYPEYTAPSMPDLHNQSNENRNVLDECMEQSLEAIKISFSAFLKSLSFES